MRHAESEWNVLGRWTGRTDVSITEKGAQQAADVGQLIQDITVHHAFTSEQKRTQQTLHHILRAINQNPQSSSTSLHLNERDYGDYTGLNKWEVLERLGEDVFTKIRRSWDHPVPNGETLEMVYQRAVPFLKAQIVPKLHAGENVLVVSHGNTIRSLMKFIEDISDEDIASVEMHFGHVVMYRVDEQGRHMHKDTRQIILDPPKA